MKPIYFLCLLFSLVFLSDVAHAGRCNPNGICTACKNCSACKHCNSGGSCSVCRGGSSRSSNTTYPSTSRRTPSATYYPPRPSTTYYPPNWPYGTGGRSNPSYTPPTPKPTPKPRPRRVKQDITVPSQFSARVVGIQDGDTITVLYFERYQIKVRLYGIDAPENSQPFGNASKKKLSDLVFGKNVTLYTKGKDRYGRLLAWVFNGPICANKEMVRSGMAWWYRQYAPKENGLRLAEQEARGRKAGLWADRSPVPPWNWRKR